MIHRLLGESGFIPVHVTGKTGDGGIDGVGIAQIIRSAEFPCALETFTRDAVKEATRDGAPPIDLIDGEQLIQRLKDLELGIKVKTVELVEVDVGWFENL